MSVSSVRAAQPSHVPAAAVYEFDIHNDAGLLVDPHRRSLALKQAVPPVFWTPFNGGHWVVLNYDDAHAVPRQPEIYSSTLILPLQKAFSPKTIQALEDDIAQLANQLISNVEKLGTCDFIATVAEPFPVRIFLKMMGLPESRLAEFRALAHEVFAPRENDAMAVLVMRKIADAMKDEIQDRHERPQQDLISMLWAIEVDGEPISTELMEDYAVLLFLAGLDTVVNAISFGMHHLTCDQELQSTLRTSPHLIAETIEELLRRYTFTVAVRRTIRDTQLGGWTIKAGERVISYFPAADLDKNEFPDATAFDIARENKRHMAFGIGPHRCLGAHLARLELQTLYRIVLECLPTFRLDPEKSVLYRAGMNLSIPSLHLRWD